MLRRAHSRKVSRHRWQRTTVWVGVLLGVWGALVGDLDPVTWAGGAVLAVVAALAARLVASQGLLNHTFRRAWLSEVGTAVRQVPADFALVTLVLAHTMRTRTHAGGGGFLARDFAAGGDTPRGRSWRALVGVVASLSPNSYVVDIDRAHDRRLSHDLLPRRSSERPA